MFRKNLFLAPVAIFFLEYLCNFCRGDYEYHLCEIILNMDQILFKEFVLALVAGHFVLWSGTICEKAYRH